jgi:hypothetical protein
MEAFVRFLDNYAPPWGIILKLPERREIILRLGPGEHLNN